jgi:hypothetical protein
MGTGRRGETCLESVVVDFDVITKFGAQIFGIAQVDVGRGLASLHLLRAVEALVCFVFKFLSCLFSDLEMIIFFRKQSPRDIRDYTALTR